MCVSLLTCLFLFFFLLFSLSSFSFSFSFCFSLSFFFTARTETRSDRQVTLPIKNGHAPRDPLNQERSYRHTRTALNTDTHHEPRAPNFHNTNSKETTHQITHETHTYEHEHTHHHAETNTKQTRPTTTPMPKNPNTNHDQTHTDSGYL